MFKKKIRPTLLNVEDFKYLVPQEHIWPQLLLGINIPQQAFKSAFSPVLNYKFTPKFVWHKISHQNQHWIGTFLHPKDTSTFNVLRRLVTNWNDAEEINSACNSVDTFIKYRRDLREKLNIDCNYSYKFLEKGIYPVDTNPLFLEKLVAENLPHDLDELIEWKSGLDRAIGCIRRWNFVVLGDAFN